MTMEEEVVLAQPLPVILEIFSMHRGKMRIDDPTLPRLGTDSIPLDLSIDAPIFSECSLRFHPVDRGRTASYPTAPAQIPACSFPAPGSSWILASAARLSDEQLPNPISAGPRCAVVRVQSVL